MLCLRRLSNNCSHSLFGGRWVRRYFGEPSRKMLKAYLRYLDGSESFRLSFNVQNASLGVNREFNFSRQVTENVSALLNRIASNIEKVHDKKKKKKKKLLEQEETSADSSCIRIDLVKNGSSVPVDTMCKDVLFGNSLHLVICGVEYEVIMNAPWVDILSLPPNIMAGFPVYPNKFECVFSERSNSLFSWYRGTPNKKQWVEIGNDYFYNPTTDDIGYLLKFMCVPGNGRIYGPSYDAVSKNTVQAGPGHCPFETRHSFTKERAEWPIFRVVSYNILADLYADSDVARNQLYPYCPAYALGIDYRKQLICKELIDYNSDILCLQEVDQKVFTNSLQPLLHHLGFKGVFNKKGGQVSEGLACFFYSSKFSCISSHCIYLANELPKDPIFADLWTKLEDNTSFISRFKERTTTLSVTILQSTFNTNEVFIVGNTHLYFHPDADHIRLFQSGMVMRFMEHLRDNFVASRPEAHVSIVLCGDFNSTPDCGVYELMTRQQVPEDHKDWSSNLDEAIHNISLSHTTPLKSACGTPEITNFTLGFFGCLDYIFYQNDHMSVSQVIPFPSQEEFKQHTALPSVVFPSDHIALVCDLRLS